MVMPLTSLDRVYAVVPAAGIGSRMQGIVPKQYLPLGNCTVIEQTLRVFLAQPLIQRIIVVISRQDTLFNTLALAADPRIEVTYGGAKRADSVLAGLQRLSEGWVVVHDAVRPCLDPTDLEQLLQCRHSATAGAVLATPIRDSIKYSNDNRTIHHTLQRKQLWHALTPQLFPITLLKGCLQRAHAAAGIEISDEASALEYCAHSPVLINGRADNIKITYPEDLAFAAYYLKCKIQQESR